MLRYEAFCDPEEAELIVRSWEVGSAEAVGLGRRPRWHLRIELALPLRELRGLGLMNAEDADLGEVLYLLSAARELLRWNGEGAGFRLDEVSLPLLEAFGAL